MAVDARKFPSAIESVCKTFRGEAAVTQANRNTTFQSPLI